MESTKGIATYHFNTKTNHILKVAMEYMELIRKGCLTNISQQSQFLVNKGLTTQQDSQKFSMAITAASPEWQTIASDYRNYGRAQAWENNHDATLFRMALSIFDSNNATINEQRKCFSPPRGKPETVNLAAANDHSDNPKMAFRVEEQSEADHQQVEQQPQENTTALTFFPVSETPTNLSDLQKMAASVANGLGAYTIKFEKTSKQLEEECGKTKQLEQEKAEQNKLIASLQREKAALAARVADLSKTIDEGRKEKVASSNEVNTLRKAKKELETENHGLANEKSELETENLRLTNEKKQLETENHRLTNELYQRDEEIENFRRKRKRLKTENAQLKEQMASHDKTYGAFVDAAKQAAMIESKPDIRRESLQKMDDYQELQKQFNALDDKYRQATENLSFQTSQYQKEREKKMALKDELTQLKSFLQQLQQQEQSSHVKSPPKEEPIDDCYDIDI